MPLFDVETSRLVRVRQADGTRRQYPVSELRRLARDHQYWRGTDAFDCFTAAGSSNRFTLKFHPDSERRRGRDSAVDPSVDLPAWDSYLAGVVQAGVRCIGVGEAITQSTGRFHDTG
jgi:hypothetical protein